MLDKVVSGQLMALTHIHTYLVYPRDAGGGQSGGAAVPLEGKLFELLHDVYAKSDNECDIDISFNPRSEGVQTNPIRDLVMAYLSAPDLERGRLIAEALKKVTTKRSGMGLLFLISGADGAEHKIVISRFPADNGILAEEALHGLNVEFLERVFLKSQHSYKAAMYRGPSLSAGFWQGRAIDKQVGNPIVRVSEYWIKGFLDSDFRTTSAAGTRRLAIALRDAAKTADDVSVRQEITAAATLAGNLTGQQISIEEFQQRFTLSKPAIEAMNRKIRNPDTLREKFLFASEEFSREVGFRSVELDSGALLTAQASTFDSVFSREDLEDGEVRFSATGTVVNDRLRKATAS